MNSTYAQKSTPVQKKNASNTACVVDNSSQGECLQQKNEMMASKSVLQLLTEEQRICMTQHKPVFNLHDEFVSKHLPKDEAMSAKERQDRGMKRFASCKPGESEKEKNRRLKVDKKEKPSSVIVGTLTGGGKKILKRERDRLDYLKEKIEEEAQQKINVGNAIVYYYDNGQIQVGLPMSNFIVKTTVIDKGKITEEKTENAHFHICGAWTNNEINGFHYEGNFKRENNGKIHPKSMIYKEKK